MKQYVAGGTIYGKDTCPTESVKGLAGVKRQERRLNHKFVHLPRLNRWPAFSLTVITTCTFFGVDYDINTAGEGALPAVHMYILV